MATKKINMIAGLYNAFAFETITVGTTAVGFTTATYKTDTHTAQRAVVTIEDAGVRYRYDGTNPTSSVGHQLNPGDTLLVVGRGNLDNIKFIRSGTSDGKVVATYED